VNYPGGKNKLYQKIINLIPPHRIYIEPFVGSGAVLRNKRPAVGNIAIDADTSAIKQLRYLIAKDDDTSGHTFLNTDAIKWLSTYPFQGDEFIYADPPYLMSTRRQHRRLYRCEMADSQHIDLLTILISLPCKIMISGYYSQLYTNRLNEWHSISFDVITRGGSWAAEYLWMNYPPPTELHDYRYLGDTFRERERIKRKKKRWVSQLQKMPMLERRAILSAINEVI
jgi:site-specific DNA-adenine methylase